MNLNSNKIDEYLRNVLSEEDKLNFEHLIEQNPILKSEVDFQKDVIDGLKSYRKAELKNRLDNVSVNSSILYNLPKTALIATIFIAVTLTSILILFDNIKNPFKKDGLTKENYKEEIINPEVKLDKSRLYSKNSNETLPIKAPNLIQRQSILEEIREVEIINNIDDIDNNYPINLIKKSRENTQHQLSSFKINFDKNTEKISKGKSILLIAKEDNLIKEEQEYKSDKTYNYNSNEEADKSVYDGREEMSLENIAANNIAKNKNSSILNRGERVSLQEENMDLYFLYYEDKFYEVESYHIDVEDEELKIVRNPKLLNRLKQRIK